MASDPSNYHREYSPYGSYSLFQLEGSDVLSVLKKSIEYSFVLFKCLSEVTKINHVFISQYYHQSYSEYVICNDTGGLSTVFKLPFCKKF